MSEDWKKLTQGWGFKVMFILALGGVLTLGLGMQNHLVLERQTFRDEAVDRTVDEWGGEQRFAGPFLKIPYRETVSNGALGSEIRESFAYLLPQTFLAETLLESEQRTRGIYEVPLYRASLEVSGTFSMPAQRDWIPAGAEVLWNSAELCYFLGSAAGLDERPAVHYGRQDRESVRVSLDVPSAVDALASRVELPAPGETKAFRLTLVLKGGASFGVFPAGQDSLIRVSSDGGLPAFGGSYLPSTRELREAGFQAEWRIPALARPVPALGTAQTWGALLSSMPYASFDLSVAFDGYKLINRALKYGILFIFVPFLGLFLYEVFARCRLHPIQYLLVGAAVLMFYLLVLTLSERMPFEGAFWAGALAVSGLLGYYGASILRGGWAGMWFFLGMTGLYGLLYLILRSEDNALLVGTLFLFALVAGVMVATRRTDWYRIRGAGPGESE